MPTKAPVKRKNPKRSRKIEERSQEDPVHAWREEEETERETLEFIQAVDRYKRKTQKSFPSWSEILEILKSLGYERPKK